LMECVNNIENRSMIRLKKSPKFLVVQYAPGSAGKFLIAVLMASPSIAHFLPEVESEKNNNKCLDFIKQSFIGDFEKWISTEPQHAMAWNLHFTSAKYPRGDDLSFDQFVELAETESTDHFVDSVNAGKQIIIARHKTVPTDFFSDSDFVTIKLDLQSLKWYHRAYWSKLFGIKNNMIHIKENDPELINQPMKKYLFKNNNSVYVEQSVFSFIRNNIIKSQYKEKFLAPGINPSKNHIIVNLTEILVESRFVASVNAITEQFSLGTIDEKFIRSAHRHWISLHPYTANTC
jgi:hypothetical protein